MEEDEEQYAAEKSGLQTLRETEVTEGARSARGGSMFQRHSASSTFLQSGNRFLAASDTTRVFLPESQSPSMQLHISSVTPPAPPLDPWATGDSDPRPRAHPPHQRSFQA